MYASLVALSVPAAAAQLTFTMFGDWGSGSDIQTSAAKDLAKVAQQVNSSFHIAAGDNFYTAGVKSETDPLWKSRFEDMYNQGGPIVQRPWYVVEGNHDHDGNAEAQLQYAQDHKGGRWQFPAYHWQKTVAIPGGGSLNMIFIDTVLWGNGDQKAFVEENLKNNTATWTAVIGHYPVWSIAEHGPTANLVSDLKPLLDQYKVDFYFCGHDHSMQHLQQGNTEYILNGQGGQSDPSNAHKDAVPAGVSKWFDDNGLGGFCAIELTKDSATVDFYSSTKGKVYNVTKKPNSLTKPASFVDTYKYNMNGWFDYDEFHKELYAKLGINKKF